MGQVKGSDVINCQLQGMTKDGAEKALGGENVGGLDGFKLDRMSQDLGSVKTGGGSNAADLSAKAFTQGNDVFFKGSNPLDKQLLGHELSHVVQQRQGRVP